MNSAGLIRIPGLDSFFCSVYGLSHPLASLDQMNPGTTRQDLLSHAQSSAPMVLHDAFQGGGPNPSADLYPNRDAKTARRELAMLSVNAKQKLQASYMQAQNGGTADLARKYALHVAISAAYAG